MSDQDTSEVQEVEATVVYISGTAGGVGGMGKPEETPAEETPATVVYISGHATRHDLQKDADE